MKTNKKFLFFLPLFLLASSSSWAQTVTKTVRISFEIEPVTVMKVSSEAGVSAVRLGPISPRAEVPAQALEVAIVTNAHQRYRVYHELREDVTNAAGVQFPLEHLLFMVTSGTHGGVSEVPSFSKVPHGGILIFTSKVDGGSDVFRILYSVDNKKLFSAGLYYGNIHIDIRNE